jgi:pimeloyl-ACP methyl ester carboxylesterase
MDKSEFLTALGVRLRPRSQRPGPYNWLFFPGGPGIGSESLHELVDALAVPGTCWLVDLPADGSNTDLPPAPGGHYQHWPQVLLEAARALPDCVAVGHSTGGMYLLSVPELAPLLRGLVLVSTAPDASWHPRYVAMTQQYPLAAMPEALRRFEQEPTNERLREVAVASAEWNFTPAGLEAGRDLLTRMPYNLAAVEWSDQFFDHLYAAKWWPQEIPTLIVSGGNDRIVDQSLWDAAPFQASNVLHRTIPQAGHFPWIEQPAAVRAAFDELTARL